MVIKIPAGTRIYLTKKKPHALYIQPDKTLVNDNLYVAYDVRIGCHTIIPKGTRVLGDWVTESRPSIAAQLQIKKIFLQGAGQDISADSDVIEAITEYNNKEVNNAGYLYKTNQYGSVSGITRRVAKFHCKIKTLLDNNRDTIYLEIFTKEIPVEFTMDFVPYPYL